MSYTGVDHMGWMLCDGRVVSRTTYALLFGVIGETFGAGDGSTTFKLPDFRGMVPGMAGQPNFSNAVNPTNYALGTATGEQQHKLTIDEMPAHKHGSVDVSGNTNGNGYTTINGDHYHTGTTSNNSGTIVTDVSYGNHGIDIAGSYDVATSDTTGTHTHTFQTSNAGDHQHQMGSTGGSNFHNNMQPTLFAGNMFIYSGRSMDGYFPYTWVGGVPQPNGTTPTPGNVLIF